MNGFMRFTVCLLGLLGYSATMAAYDHTNPSAEDPYEYVIRDHAMFLNELSNRRRVNTLFQNEQSALYGVQFRYVNSSRGNLTFVRRDIVTVGRVPIVVGRVYDSMSRTEEGFGPGWRLSFAETMYEPAEDTLRYIDDSGSQTVLIWPSRSSMSAGDSRGFTNVDRASRRSRTLDEQRDARGNGCDDGSF